MAANNISTLTYKRDRQDQKLALAAIDRAATGRPSTLDETLLPILYGVGSNDPADFVYNSHPTGLQLGRPWTP